MMTAETELPSKRFFQVNIPRTYIHATSMHAKLRRRSI